jgi:hypothetical protein
LSQQEQGDQEKCEFVQNLNLIKNSELLLDLEELEKSDGG